MAAASTSNEFANVKRWYVSMAERPAVQRGYHVPKADAGNPDAVNPKEPWKGYAMRALVLDGGFGFDQLGVVERAVPVPGPGEVLVRVGAASLNYRDVLLVEGVYNPRQALPVVPVTDAAGVVESVGAGVTRFAPGDRVVNLFVEGWTGWRPGCDDARNGARRSRRRRCLVGLHDLSRKRAVSGSRTSLACPGRDAALRRTDRLERGCRTWWSAPRWYCCDRGNRRRGAVRNAVRPTRRCAGTRDLVIRHQARWIADLGADVTVNYGEVPECGRVVSR